MRAETTTSPPYATTRGSRRLFAERVGLDPRRAEPGRPTVPHAGPAHAPVAGRSRATRLTPKREPWDQNVSSYAIDNGERLLLFDPISPPSEIENLAAEREAAVVLTAPWHERDTQRLVERLGLPVYTPLPDTAEYLMQTYDITAEQAGDGSPDVVWLLKEGIGEAHPYAAGDRLDVGVDAFPGQKPNDMVLWIESHRTVIAGDTLVDSGNGLEINARSLQQQRVTREQVVEGLRPLLELPVEHMLATHGGPHDRAALERAPSTS